MIKYRQLNFSSYKQGKAANQLKFSQQILVDLLRLLPLKAAYKLTYFEKLLNFLRVIGLYMYKQNSQHISPPINQGDLKNHKNSVLKSLTDFLVHFEILSFSGDSIKVSKDYAALLENDHIDKLIKNDGKGVKNTLNRKAKKIIRDYLFVNEMVQKYNNPDYKFKHISERKSRVGEKMIVQRELDYEIRLSETLYNLVNLKISEKIKSPFDEDYYTESGQNAFENFTRFRFTEFLENIIEDQNTLKVFDLGCGYGNYIQAIHQNFPHAAITGIEMNKKVCSATKEKFKKLESIRIVNQDFFNYAPDEQYDSILMNYVLFYFNCEEKKQILAKAKSMLTKEGAIVVCQYFSGIEPLKKDLAKKQRDYSIAKAIAMHYSNKVLYANTLWNDAVDIFSEAVKWNEFNQIIADNNLYLAGMTNADPYYYSLFIALKQKE